jgi:predicted NodU family carbamoyl transferase
MSERDVYILGLSFDYHDAAAALIKNGRVVAAAQEERFTREKHDSAFRSLGHVRRRTVKTLFIVTLNPIT